MSSGKGYLYQQLHDANRGFPLNSDVDDDHVGTGLTDQLDEHERDERQVPDESVSLYELSDRLLLNTIEMSRLLFESDDGQVADALDLSCEYNLMKQAVRRHQMDYVFDISSVDAALATDRYRSYCLAHGLSENDKKCVGYVMTFSLHPDPNAQTQQLRELLAKVWEGIMAIKSKTHWAHAAILRLVLSNRDHETGLYDCIVDGTLVGLECWSHFSLADLYNIFQLSFDEVRLLKTVVKITPSKDTDLMFDMGIDRRNEKNATPKRYALIGEDLPTECFSEVLKIMKTNLASGTWSISHCVRYHGLFHSRAQAQLLQIERTNACKTTIRGNVRVFLIVGDSRSGKSHYALNFLGDPSKTWSPVENDQFNCGYNGQPVVIIDEVHKIRNRGNGVYTFGALNKICSADPYVMNAKYTFSILRAQYVFIISNFPPRQWTDDLEGDRRLPILLNRVHYEARFARCESTGGFVREWRHGPAWELESNLAEQDLMLPPLPDSSEFRLDL